MQNRTKNKQIVFRMSDDEYFKIKKKIEQSGLSQQEYLIRAVTNKRIIVIDGFRELVVELKRIGNNLNQITMACNAGIPYKKEEISNIEKELKEVWQLLRQLAQKQA